MSANPEPKDRFKGRVIRVFISSTFRDMHAEHFGLRSGLGKSLI